MVSSPTLSLVVMSIYTGISQGIQPLLSSGYGTGNRKKTQSVLRYALVLSRAHLGGRLCLCILRRRPDRRCVQQRAECHAAEHCRDRAEDLLYGVGVFAGFNIILSVYFTSTENALPAHIISILRGFVVIIPMAFLLSAAAELTGVWAAFPATELIVSLIGAGLFFRIGKRDRMIYLIEFSPLQ